MKEYFKTFLTLALFLPIINCAILNAQKILKKKYHASQSEDPRIYKVHFDPEVTESERTIRAEYILNALEKGKHIDIKHAIVEGNLDFTKLNFPLINAGDIGFSEEK